MSTPSTDTPDDTLITEAPNPETAAESEPLTGSEHERVIGAWALKAKHARVSPETSAWASSRGLTGTTCAEYGAIYFPPSVILPETARELASDLGVDVPALIRCGILHRRRLCPYTEPPRTGTKHDLDTDYVDRRPRLLGYRAIHGGRIVYPLLDLAAKARGLKSRAIHDDLRAAAGDFRVEEADPPTNVKYLHSKRPEGEERAFQLLFSPSMISIIGGSIAAAKAANPKNLKGDDRRSVWITEGDVDAMLAHQAGAMSVGLGGCATNEGQIGDLMPALEEAAKQHLPIYLCLDSDPVRWDRGKELSLGAGQRGVCDLISRIRARRPKVARLIKVVELTAGPSVTKQDLADVLCAAGDRAAQATKLKELEAGAVEAHVYQIHQIPGDLKPRDRTATLEETGLSLLAGVDPDLWVEIAEEVAVKLGIPKKEIPGWGKRIAKEAGEAAEAAAAKAKVGADDPLERFRTKDGSIFPCWRSAVAILDAAYGGRLRWNEMGLQPVIETPSGELLKFGAAQFADIRMRMSDEWGCNIRKQDLEDAVGDVARENPIHPGRSWFRALPEWDGKDYIPDLMVAMGLTEDRGVPQDRLRLYGTYLRKTLVALVARCMEPGCQVDTMLVLQGQQGVRKSSFFRSLLPELEWYGSAGRLDPENKDSLLCIRKKLLLEVAEVDKKSFYNSESEWKDLISCPVDSLRPPYMREIEDYPRSSIFVGTTNALQFLSDPTGARRFWVIELNLEKLKGETIDTDLIERIRDQIWAQALAIYDAWVAGGRKKVECPWWLDLVEDKVHAIDITRHKLDDLDLDKLRVWLDGQTSRSVTGVEICDQIGWDRAKYGKRISQWMEGLGWTKSHTKTGATYTAPDTWRPGASGLGVHTGGAAPEEIEASVRGILNLD